MNYFENIAKPLNDPKKAGAIKPKWIYAQEELKQSPSIMSGILYSEEQQRIRIGATFMREIAERMNILGEDVEISRTCISVSLIQLRRFFVVHSLAEFEVRDVASVILYMTSKSEECPQQLSQLIPVWYKLCHEYDEKAANPNEEIGFNNEAYDCFCEYFRWIENIILKTAGFHLCVKIPHPFAMKLLLNYQPDDKKLQEMLLSLTTDVLHLTDWAVRFKAEKIGAVCFYITILWKDKLAPFPPNDNDNRPWYYQLDPTLTLNELQDLAHEFLQIWKAVDKTTVLSMSPFDHKSTPEILELFTFN